MSDRPSTAEATPQSRVDRSPTEHVVRRIGRIADGHPTGPEVLRRVASTVVVQTGSEEAGEFRQPRRGVVRGVGTGGRECPFAGQEWKRSHRVCRHSRRREEEGIQGKESAETPAVCLIDRAISVAEENSPK